MRRSAAASIIVTSRDGNLDLGKANLAGDTASLLLNCMNDVPQRLPRDSRLKKNWIKVKAVGTKSNRECDRSAHPLHGGDRRKSAASGRVAAAEVSFRRATSAFTSG
jgi:hypothetical protein